MPRPIIVTTTPRPTPPPEVATHRKVATAAITPQRGDPAFADPSVVAIKKIHADHRARTAIAKAAAKAPRKTLALPKSRYPARAEKSIGGPLSWSVLADATPRHGDSLRHRITRRKD